MSALLFSMNNSLSPSEVKQYLTENGANSELRYTGTCDNKGVCSTQQLSKTSKASIRIPNLNQTYGKLKIKFMLEARTDSRLITNLDIPISNNLDCSRLWSEGGSKRSVRSLKKDYEPLFYGNKCLYFRGNSFIIEYDIPSKLAKSLYYGDAYYDEYQTVRKFINNMKSAKTDETWRQGYGVGLNEHGNVACLSEKPIDCTSSVIKLGHENICGDIWFSLTGNTKTISHGAYYNICRYSNADYLQNILYNTYTEELFFVDNPPINLESGVVINKSTQFILNAEIPGTYPYRFSAVDKFGNSKTMKGAILTYGKYSQRYDFTSLINPTYLRKGIITFTFENAEIGDIIKLYASSIEI